MDCFPVPVNENSARKRKRNPDKWKRNIAKVKRYSPKTLPMRPLCKHKKKFECLSLSMKDIKSFHDNFYKFKNKSDQDAFILKHCVIKPTQRHRPTTGNHKPKSSQVSYYVYSLTSKKRLQVCQKFFLILLQITKYRVQSVMTEYFKTGALLKEKRGGDHVSHKYAHKKRAIMDFISKLKCGEPHYCRGKSKRYYLPAELSINKLWLMYNNSSQDDLKVKKSYFRDVFNQNYNLGFGSPRTDVCSTCLQFNEKMKTEKDTKVRNKLLIDQRVHKLKANAFFGYVKEEQSDLLTLSFDCQKNLCLPKTPDQSAYYSRQINLFNFTIVQGSSKSKLDPSKVFSYCWVENSFPKASNEIASAVYHRLQNTELAGIKTIRMIADGCAGQNKNTTVLAMCTKWLAEAPRHIKTLELIFPVVGHSFIPPDRVFAQIEKEIRKREIIANPDEYYDIIKDFGQVISLGDVCKVFNWKDDASKVIKPVGRWHFQFKNAKRYILKRSKKEGNVLIKGNMHYKHDDGVFKNVNLPGKLTINLNPVEILPLNKISDSKASDVRKLLINHYGVNWQNVERLNFFVPLISTLNDELPLINSHVAENTEDDEEEEVLCEYQEEISGMLI